MSAEEGKPKIGAGHAGAMARQGLAELRAAFYPDSNIAQPTEYGMAGRPTPQEVVWGKEGDGRDDAPSVIDSRLGGESPTEERGDKQREPREPDRD